MSNESRVVVIGGGFGGLNVVKPLRHKPIQITLIDRQNYHLFRPLLYQVAMAGLSPGDIAFPLRAIFRGADNVWTVLAEVTAIDAAQRRVIFGDGRSEPYDYLVVAGGARYNYFGHDDWVAHAPSLEGVEGALEVRQRLLMAYEQAELATSLSEKEAWMTFVVVGAGPTGVELAGAIAELARHTLSQNFRTIDPAATRVLLVEALDRILNSFPPKLSARAEASLAELGVSVKTGTKVVEITDDYVLVEEAGQRERIACRTTLWAAGVRAAQLGVILHEATGVELDRQGRVKILPDLTVPGHPEIYVIGDMAMLEQDGKALPGLAPVAVQQGKHVAAQLLANPHSPTRRPFRYVDRGNLATIGRAAAVADFHFLRLSGFVAWLAWLVIHLINLIGFRNRLSVLTQWIFHYITYSRSVRLIIRRRETIPLPAQSDGATSTDKDEGTSVKTVK